MLNSLHEAISDLQSHAKS